MSDEDAAAGAGQVNSSSQSLVVCIEVDDDMCMLQGYAQR